MSYSKATRARYRTDIIERSISIGLLAVLETDLTFVEVAAEEYERQPLTMGAVPETEEITNFNRIEFPRVEEDWGEVAGYGLFDAAGGLVYQLVLFEPITMPRNLRYGLEPGAVRILIQ